MEVVAGTRIAAIAAIALFGVTPLAACGGDEDGEESVMGTFVGKTSDPDLFAAVVAANADGGDGSRDVRVLLYGRGANGRNPVNQWYPGSAEGNEFEVASERGQSRVTVELTPKAAKGDFTRVDGKPVSFEASRATGVAGLYEATVFGDGRVRGSSESGARLEGQVATKPRTNGLYPITTTLTAPDGGKRNLTLLSPAAQPAKPIELRLIILSSGEVRGGPKSPSVSSRVGFSVNLVLL